VASIAFVLCLKKKVAEEVAVARRRRRVDGDVVEAGPADRDPVVGGGKLRGRRSEGDGRRGLAGGEEGEAYLSGCRRLTWHLDEQRVTDEVGPTELAV
jgi:hypothetical protein